jgi:alanine racemase
MKRAICEIDLGQYQKNIGRIRSIISKRTRIMAVIKADAYGHGALEIASAAEKIGIDFLGVAWLSEAIQLRKNKIQTPILVLSESQTDSPTELVRNNIDQTLYTFGMAQALNGAAGKVGKIAKVHIKVDTGMGRVGCRPEECADLIYAVSKLPHVQINGIFTHFANADSASDPMTNLQLSKFVWALESARPMLKHPVLVHAANSDATLYFPNSHFDMVRIGLFGYQGILTLKSRIGFIKTVPANTRLSYHGTYTTRDVCEIATIHVGYADGVPRQLSNLRSNNHGYVNGKSGSKSGFGLGWRRSCHHGPPRCKCDHRSRYLPTHRPDPVRSHVPGWKTVGKSLPLRKLPNHVRQDALGGYLFGIFFRKSPPLPG